MTGQPTQHPASTNTARQQVDAHVDEPNTAREQQLHTHVDKPNTKREQQADAHVDRRLPVVGLDVMPLRLLELALRLQLLRQVQVRFSQKVFPVLSDEPNHVLVMPVLLVPEQRG